MWVTKTRHETQNLHYLAHKEQRPDLTHKTYTILHVSNKDLTHKTYTNLNVSNKDLTQDTQNLHYLAHE